ncbi:MAG: hypothetical protein Q7S02_00650, partial [bacterium]|nr:hypothetical protein [bacterium]
MDRNLRTIARVPGLTTDDRVEVAGTIEEFQGIRDDMLLRYFVRMNAGPMELPTGTPSDDIAFWERCIEKLAKVQPDPKKLAETKVLKRLGHQLHRAVAIELLGREPLSPKEERKVQEALRRRARG